MYNFFKKKREEKKLQNNKDKKKIDIKYKVINIQSVKNKKIIFFPEKWCKEKKKEKLKKYYKKKEKNCDKPVKYKIIKISSNFLLKNPENYNFDIPTV